MKGIKFIQMFETKGGSELVFLGQLDILEDLEFDDVVKRIALPNGHKGKWLETKRNVMGEGFMWKCSVCTNEVYVSSKGDFPKYCDECGAKMESEE